MGLSQTLPGTLTEAPQTHKELVAQVPASDEFADAMPSLGQTQHPVSPKVTVQPPDHPVSASPSPPANPELTPVDQALHAGHAVTPQAATVAKQPPTPPEPPEEMVAQSPAPASGQDQAQPSVSPTSEAERSEAPKTTASPPKHSEATSPDHGQTQNPNPAEVTFPPLDVGLTTAQQFESSNNDVKQTVSTDFNVCQLCRCENATLSCTGLSPAQKLRQVPTQDPSTYNGTFTVL